MDSKGEGAGGGSKKGSVDNSQGASGGPESGDVAEGAVAQTQGPRPALVPGGEQAPGAAPGRILLIEFILTVPFQSCTEADIARRTLLPVAERLVGVVGKDVTVNGRDLTVHLTADDSSRLHIAIATMVSHLHQLVQAMQNHWYSCLRNLWSRKDG
ncbi:EKC/KEOPS complex subunit LAGE3-like [Echinops telfairi]|uniref:EKC/KEOPS complex subunit LAGE3-like n=1 Tax=Echinops telfairi TaxID=9371 RepID=A0AC55CPL5_ECHTE|nr:EKC/KEOPS complex subunit LAGE3-like [Echinops telfairi]